MAPFGIFGSHTVESCPLNDRASAKMIIQIAQKSADITDNHNNYGIHKVIGTHVIRI